MGRNFNVLAATAATALAVAGCGGSPERPAPKPYGPERPEIPFGEPVDAPSMRYPLPAYCTERRDTLERGDVSTISVLSGPGSRTGRPLTITVQNLPESKFDHTAHQSAVSIAYQQAPSERIRHIAIFNRWIGSASLGEGSTVVIDLNGVSPDEGSATAIEVAAQFCTKNQ